jgi:hypothetical protein
LLLELPRKSIEPMVLVLHGPQRKAVRLMFPYWYPRMVELL